MANGDKVATVDEVADAEKSEHWMSDVQRAIALILVGAIAFCTVLSTMVAVWVTEPSDALVDMVKTLQAAVVNMTLIALGFFFGSNMSKLLADKGQQRIVEKLTSPPPLGPVAPVPSAPVVVAWWSVLTPDEQAAITDAGVTDMRIAGFIATAQAGKASTDDLDYLVNKGLLTAERAAVIRAI